MAPRKKAHTKKAASKKPAARKTHSKRVMSDDEDISEVPSPILTKRIRRNPARAAKKNPDYYISSAEKPVKKSRNAENPDEDEHALEGSSDIPTKRASKSPVREESESLDDDVSSAEEVTDESENTDNSDEDDTLETPPSVPSKRARKKPKYVDSSVGKGIEKSENTDDSGGDDGISEIESSISTNGARKNSDREERDSPDEDYIPSFEIGTNKPLNTDDPNAPDYVQIVDIPPKPPKVRKKWPRHDPPIMNFNMVPEGWEASDYLDEFDIEGNIERCHERIAEGILPFLWEQRLERYLKMREERQKIIKSWPTGLSLHVIQRLESLKKHKALLEESGKHPGQLANINAIMEAYKRKCLDCFPSMVTYWIEGTMVGKSEIYNTRTVNSRFEEYGCPENWWVEAWEDPRPGSVHWITPV